MLRGKGGLTLAERLERLSVPEPNSGCVFFMGTLQSKGYGVIRINGESVLAHRAAYELKHGEIPEDHTLDHKCRITFCINDRHLEVVTRTENTRRENVGRFAAVCKRGHPLVGANVVVYKKKRTGDGVFQVCVACRILRRKGLAR